MGAEDLDVTNRLNQTRPLTLVEPVASVPSIPTLLYGGPAHSDAIPVEIPVEPVAKQPCLSQIRRPASPSGRRTEQIVCETQAQSIPWSAQLHVPGPSGLNPRSIRQTSPV